MSDWTDFTFRLSGDISADLILDTCYEAGSPDRYDPKVRDTINGYLKHLMDFINESDVCNELLLSVLLQCIFDIFEGYQGKIPEYGCRVSDPKIHSNIINNFAYKIHEFIDSVMDDAVENSIGLIVSNEDVDRSTLKVDCITGIALDDYELNTFREDTIQTVAENNLLAKNLHDSAPVFELLFDYLYYSGLLEEVYYRIMDLYNLRGIKNYNILGANILVRRIGYSDLYRLDLSGDITFNHYSGYHTTSQQTVPRY